MNILFTSVGRRVSLIQQFKTSMGKLGIQGSIVATDLNKTAPALFVADYQEQTPRVTQPEYLENLLGICKRHEIRLLIPLIDTELYLLSTWKHHFTEIGVQLLVSSPEANKICIDKRNTHNFFKENHISTARLYSIKEIKNDKNIAYPLIVKPSDGSCSIGVHRVHTFEELEFHFNHTKNAIIQECLPGQEYTLDILVDFQGNVKVIVPRLRMETRAGEISKGITVKDLALIEAGKKVAESLPGAVGCVTAQCFLTPEGDIKFIEINPRFGGGFPLSYHAGADFPGLILEMLQGKEINVSVDDWQDGVVMLRYDDAIFTTQEGIGILK